MELLDGDSPGDGSGYESPGATQGGRSPRRKPLSCAWVSRARDWVVIMSRAQGGIRSPLMPFPCGQWEEPWCRGRGWRGGSCGYVWMPFLSLSTSLSSFRGQLKPQFFQEAFLDLSRKPRLFFPPLNSCCVCITGSSHCSALSHRGLPPWIM